MSLVRWRPGGTGGPPSLRARWWACRTGGEDAGIQMELLGHDFFAFVNIETERTNVLYRRKDGNLGLLEPES